MRLSCPLCGDRDLREFTYRGAANLLDRPGEDAGPEAIDAYLHLRDNPAGPNAELWHHAFGCRAWLRVVRDTRTHAILEVGLARNERRGGALALAIPVQPAEQADGGSAA
jgi:heterotetrameric sarcosine oxidase delta subunit